MKESLKIMGTHTNTNTDRPISSLDNPETLNAQSTVDSQQPIWQKNTQPKSEYIATLLINLAIFIFINNLPLKMASNLNKKAE